MRIVDQIWFYHGAARDSADSILEDEATADRVSATTRRPPQRRSWWQSLYRIIIDRPTSFP